MKVDKISADIVPLKQQSILKDDQLKTYRDDTMKLLKVLEDKASLRIFFDCMIESNSRLERMDLLAR